MKVRNRFLVILGIAWGPCLLVAMVCYAAILRPQWHCRKNLEAQVASRRQEYARALLAAKEERENPLTEEVERLHRRIGDFVVPVADAPDLAFQISALAHEGKLESFGMKPAAKGGSEGSRDLERLTTKRVDLSFAARFPRFAAFLNTLERHRPVLFVETFAITRPVGQQSEPRASIEVALLMEKTAGSTGASP